MISNIPAHWYGYIVGVLGVIFPFLLSWKRGKVDESALVLGEWRRLYDAHEKRIESYEKKIEGYESEMGRLRERLNVAEQRILQLEQVVVSKDQALLRKDEEIAGLQRQIGQITQSSAVILEGNGSSADIASAVSRTIAARRKGRDGE